MENIYQYGKISVIGELSSEKHRKEVESWYRGRGFSKKKKVETAREGKGRNGLYRKYKKYLVNPVWQRKKEYYGRILREMGLPLCCVGCGFTNRGQWKSLHLHPMSYTRLRHERVFDMVLVCNECHTYINKVEFECQDHGRFIEEETGRNITKQCIRELNEKNGYDGSLVINALTKMKNTPKSQRPGHGKDL